MILNMRGGLGNQIIQLSYALNKSRSLLVNINAVKIRPQLVGLYGYKTLNSRILNYVGGGLRKIYSYAVGYNVDTAILGLNDGYFQYGDISNLIPQSLSNHLSEQLVDTKQSCDAVLHIRGGDYLGEREKVVYEDLGLHYYHEAILAVSEYIGTSNLSLVVVTNDSKHCSNIIEKLKAELANSNIFVSFNFHIGTEWEDFSFICKAPIAVIPNSTFSLTARMINYSGLTIAPKRWFTSACGLSNPFVSRFRYL